MPEQISRHKVEVFRALLAHALRTERGASDWLTNHEIHARVCASWRRVSPTVVSTSTRELFDDDALDRLPIHPSYKYRVADCPNATYLGWLYEAARELEGCEPLPVPPAVPAAVEPLP